MTYRSIAMDGPSGAGKSTLARALAARLGFLYVDTGAIYRTVGLYTARLIGAVMAVPGVENCRLTAPTADVAAVSRTLVTLGSLTVTEGGAV